MVILSSILVSSRVPFALSFAISSASLLSCRPCSAISVAARFDVITNIAFLHSIVFPLPSVRRPSSKSCSYQNYVNYTVDTDHLSLCNSNIEVNFCQIQEVV